MFCEWREEGRKGGTAKGAAAKESANVILSEAKERSGV
jgi:hypothetical protein